MTAQAVAKELARLSYTDTMILAKKLTEELLQKSGKSLNTQEVAEAISCLSGVFMVEPDAVDTMSNDHLKKVFSGRTKSIYCTGGPQGWTVSFGHHTAVGQRLSDAINNLLDQLTTMKAMGVI
jgi:hypothetical protein